MYIVPKNPIKHQDANEHVLMFYKKNPSNVPRVFFLGESKTSIGFETGPPQQLRRSPNV